jgi:hypothetical protein
MTSWAYFLLKKPHCVVALDLGSFIIILIMVNNLLQYSAAILFPSLFSSLVSYPPTKTSRFPFHPLSLCFTTESMIWR